MNPVARHLDQARSAASARRFKDAHAACRAALELDSRCGEAWLILGDIAWTVGDLAQAAELFRQAQAAAPKDPRPLARLSAVLVALDHPAAARQAVRQALALSPDDAFTLETLAVSCAKTGDYREATPLFERAVARAPGNLGLLLNLAFARQYIGDFAGAEAACRRIIAIDPEHERAYLALVETVRQTPEHNLIAPLTALFDKVATSPERSLTAGHALAKVYEDLGDHPTALDWLARAKAGRIRATPYDPARDQALFKAAANGPRASSSATGALADAPIFVIGMPRTGTTLVDRILSSHPAVRSLGEFHAFPALAMGAAGALDSAAVGAAYMQAARAAAGPGEGRLVDKLPFNFFHAGPIHRALPNAKIVCLRRDAMDTCIANYRQLFGSESADHGYAYDLSDIARYFVQFDRLIAHWRQILPPNRFTELSYEALVDGQAAQTRRLLDFCDLAWDDRCLAFHENQAGVSTASVAQVRQPHYRSAIGRWRRYGDGVAAAQTVLQAAGLIDP